MTNEEFQAALDAQAERLRKEFAREKPWWGDRLKAIKADPQTAGLCVVVAVIADRFGLPLLKWVGVL
jgi:hypothetical protein